ncbi:2-dehydro-3-deoxygalactonokinase [Thalassotalea agariperforans]
MKTENTSLSHLIIDWGTSNFRAFAMNEHGQVVKEKTLALGLLQVKEGEFAKELQQVLSGWAEGYESLPIYMAGMVGSQQGWVNVDYVATNIADKVTSKTLAKHVHCFELPWGAKATIIPGVSHKAEFDCYDVMRGEEVQIFGALQKIENNNLHAILPGTHSKHAVIKNGQLTEFSSFMTGELFSVISQHTILGRGLPEQINSNTGFIKGVKAGQTDKLTSTLFSARTHRLFNNIAESEVFDYLSGLLIGNELKSAAKADEVTLIGGQKLCARYQVACESLGIKANYLNGDECFLAGMENLITGLSNEQ